MQERQEKVCGTRKYNLSFYSPAFPEENQDTVEIILKLSPIIFNKLQSEKLREEYASKNTVLQKVHKSEKLVSYFTRLLL